MEATRDHEDDSTTIQPLPLTDWRHIVTAYDPSSDPTEEYLGYIEDQDIVSEGVSGPEVANERKDGLRLFSDFNLDAAILARKGLHDLSVQYKKAALEIEGSFRELLKAYQVSTAEIVKSAAMPSRMISDLMAELSKLASISRSSLPPVPSEDYVAGYIKESFGSFMTLEDLETSEQYQLPSKMVRIAQLSVGDPAVLERELLSNGVVVFRLRRGISTSREKMDQEEPEAAGEPRLEKVSRNPIPTRARERLLADLRLSTPLSQRGDR